jgi:tripartite-type tricarboxylate transporter receptor subunit TctC
MKYLLLAFSFLFALTVEAKTIKIIVPFTAGGPADRISRLIEKHLDSEQYQFQIEYKLGAGGLVASNYVANTTETVIMIHSNGFIASPIINSPSASHDVVKDFILIDHLGAEPLYLVVNSNSKINSFKEFVEQSKTQYMPYGSGGVGTSGHIAGEIISRNNPNFVHVPYKGSANIVMDILNDNIKWIVDSDMNIGSFIEDRKIKPLAVAFPHRSTKYATVPTLKELGIDDMGYYRWYLVLANKSADPKIIEYVSTKLKDPSLKLRIQQLGIEPVKVNKDTFIIEETEKTKRLLKKI